MFELGGIARTILNLLGEPDMQGRALSLQFVVALLAAIGSILLPPGEKEEVPGPN
ncbi:hypothetical protein [Deinococcus hopiensis]|uniref:Uncharacterized protein n=1 Tax=Deinococcus hopiensis KR-140 TaxID=695939 RepID=A0A1W1UW57_9DEIO|nr:hypothetical protein [Deinococcus hopiensis]SMB85280.1 hypothetical protein SAMN00790413_03340 [Deinococcus hopiensis KR-140]